MGDLLVRLGCLLIAIIAAGFIALTVFLGMRRQEDEYNERGEPTDTSQNYTVGYVMAAIGCFFIAVSALVASLYWAYAYDSVGEARRRAAEVANDKVIRANEAAEQNKYEESILGDYAKLQNQPNTGKL